MDILVWVIGLINLALFLLIFVPLAQRLLGVRFGLVRLAAAGLLTLAFLPALARAILGPVPLQPGAGVSFLALVVLISILIGLVFLVVAEAVVPTGSLPRVRNLRRDVRGRFARSRRYVQILRIAVRHGLGPYLRGRRRPGAENPAEQAALATSLRLALDEAGVTFVKLGQLLSTRTDVIPEALARELSRLQDQVRPAEWVHVEQVLVAELGRAPDEVFAEFDRTPLAAASIAQVYGACLPDGERVVVKVQRPDIRPVVERDLDIVARIAHTLERNTAWGPAIGTRALANGFAQSIREELDFGVEASNMSAIAAGGSAPDGDVVFPVPRLKYSSRRVLTMQRLDGISLSGAMPVISERGLDPDALAEKLLTCLLRQIVLDGVFHADPHPGNVLLLADGRLGLLDFGSVGRLDSVLREALQRFLVAIDHRDPLGATDALLEIVDRPEEVNHQQLERAVGQFMARHLGPGSKVGAAMFTELFRIVAAHDLGVPPEVAAVFRALGTLEGTLTRIAPCFDLVASTRRFATRHVTAQLSPDRLRATMSEEFAILLPMLRRLPRRLDRIAAAAEQGRLGINVRLFADERDRRVVTGLLQQVLLTVLGATAGLMAVLLLGTGGGPAVTASVSLYQLLGYNLLVISVVLVLRVLILVFRPPD
ncbi:MAG: AarF/UbiB family protein [Actinomycetota bacterium]|nr:AarF/UbiB family protein [Actinomycetota bacterium]